MRPRRRCCAGGCRIGTKTSVNIAVQGQSGRELWLLYGWGHRRIGSAAPMARGGRRGTNAGGPAYPNPNVVPRRKTSGVRSEPPAAIAAKSWCGTEAKLASHPGGPGYNRLQVRDRRRRFTANCRRSIANCSRSNRQPQTINRQPPIVIVDRRPVDGCWQSSARYSVRKWPFLYARGVAMHRSAPSGPLQGSGTCQVRYHGHCGIIVALDSSEP